MPLTDTQIKALRASDGSKKHSDGGGLHLLVSPQDSKLWRLAYRHGGKQKLLALGAYPVTSLSDARRKRDDAKRLLATGIDPSLQAKLDKIAKQATKANTFTAIAEEYLAKSEREGKAGATMAKKRWLVGIDSGELGNRAITEISAAGILVPLRKVEALGPAVSADRNRT